MNITVILVILGNRMLLELRLIVKMLNVKELLYTMDVSSRYINVTISLTSFM